MKAFVTGATGYVGREVVRLLVERGVETVAHVRPDSARLEQWRERFDAMGARVEATAWEADAMQTVLESEAPELLFCLVGTTRARMKESGGESYESIDHGLTALLANAAVAADVGPRFVYLSAMGVKAGSKIPYYQARYKAEQAVISSGLPYVIARPGVITGPDRDEVRLGERAAGALGDALVSVAGLFGAKRLRDRYHSISNTALAMALVDAALGAEAREVVLESEDLRR
jgi:uncharacterized protein YbjT (DUF2867 family)